MPEAQTSFRQQQILEIKEQIIDAAFKCFSRYGFQGTNLTRLAEVAQCSRELPRYHFKSKEGVVAACLQSIHDLWEGILVGCALTEPTPEDFIDHIVDALIEEHEQAPERFMGKMVLIFGAADPNNPTLRTQMIATQKLGHDRFYAFLKKHTKNQPAYIGCNVQLMSQILYDAFRGIVYQCMIDPENSSYPGLLKEYKKIFLKVVNTAV